MREIKFRVWDEKLKGMFPVDRLEQEFGKWLINGNEPYWLHLMQFTGLTDKNGVEIYEGDILTFAIGLKFQRGVVVFSKGSFKFDINKPFFAKRTHVSEAIGRKGADARIIGNIHQNPELLEE